jgi:hypothetical protein
MSRADLYSMLLLTVVMVASGVREHRNNRPLAIVLIAIPVCGWAALLLGRP